MKLRIFTTLLLLGLMTSSCAEATAQQKQPVRPESHSQPDFEILKDKSIMTDFREDDLVTRAEFTAVLVRLLELPLASDHSKFEDTKAHWSDSVVAAANAKGWINGKTDTLFYPDDHITGHEVNLILGRAGIPETVSDIDTPIKRGDIAAVALAEYKRTHDSEPSTLAITKAIATSPTSVDVTFTDGKTTTTTVPSLQPARQTWETVEYNGLNYHFTVTWQGSPVTTIKTFKTRLSVHAGEVEKDRLLYLTYNEDGDTVPLRDGETVEFSSDDPHVTKDGYFDNTSNPLPVGSAVTYTATLKDRKGKVIDSAATTASIYDAAVGYRPTSFKTVTLSGKTWDSKYVTVQNDGNRDLDLMMVVGSAVDQNGTSVNLKDIAIGDHTYYSTDERIVKVDNTGKLIPVTPGIAQVGIIVGDFSYQARLEIFPEQIPTSLVYSPMVLKSGDTSFSFSVKDQFGQKLRISVDPKNFTIKSDNLDLSGANVADANGIVSVSGVNLSTGQSKINVSYDGTDLGQIILTVR